MAGEIEAAAAAQSTMHLLLRSTTLYPVVNADISLVSGKRSTGQKCEKDKIHQLDTRGTEGGRSFFSALLMVQAANHNTERAKIPIFQSPLAAGSSINQNGPRPILHGGRFADPNFRGVRNSACLEQALFPFIVHLE